MSYPGEVANAGKAGARRTTQGATDVPDTNELIDEGVAAERLGMLDRAETCYALAAATDDPAVQAVALTKLADVHRSRAQWDAALDLARRAQCVARTLSEHGILDEAIIAEANVLMCHGDFVAATAVFESLLATTREPKLRGIILQNLGSILAQKGQLGAAERAFSESYGFFRQAGYRRGEAIALNNYGRVALDQRNPELAGSLLENALLIAREVEDSDLVALTTLNLAESLARRGESKRARDLASAAFGHFDSCGNRWRQVECLRLLGAVHESEDCLDDAERCYERGLALAEQIDAQSEIATVRDALTRVRARRDHSRR
jgi:tetratricopeptide (TPR) repeat protein